jgi:phosphate:Na+ symporter
MTDLASLPVVNLVETLGGVGLFIFGMQTMSDGLQHLAGNRFRSLLERIARNRVSAALLGTGLASLLQSGSSASIFVVSFVNAGLISMYQALAILLGTCVGATVAVQFIAFQPSMFALLAIFVGILFRQLFKRRVLVHAGELFLGAGLLFLGLKVMEAGILPVGQMAIIRSITNYVFAWKISTVLFGAMLTFLVHSPAAAMGIVIAFAAGGMVSFTDAVGMVIGSNLGVALLTILAALGGTVAARRVAYLNLLINFLAVLLALALFPLLLKGVLLFSPGGTDVAAWLKHSSPVSPDKNLLPRLIANTHTLFSLFVLMVFLPCIGVITRSADAVRVWSGAKPDLSPRPQFLDIRIINTPTIAMLQAHNEIVRMADIACTMYDDTVQLLYRFDVKLVRLIQEKEELLDSLQKHISSFLILLSRRSSDAENALRIPVLLHIVNDLEHLGDVSWQIVALIQRKKYEKVTFSHQAMADLKRLAALVGEVVAVIRTADHYSEEDQERIDELHTLVLAQQEASLADHVARMKAGRCSLEAGLLFNDMIAVLVKLSALAGSIVKTGRELE